MIVTILPFNLPDRKILAAVVGRSEEDERRRDARLHAVLKRLELDIQSALDMLGYNEDEEGTDKDGVPPDPE